MLKTTFLLLTLAYLIIDVCSYASNIHQESDPCFFRLTLKDSRKLYVLGSVHSIPIEELLSDAALVELKSLATKEHPILCLEHEVNNKDALAFIKDEETTSNWYASIASNDHKFLLAEKIRVTESEICEFTLADVLKVQPWLAAPIISNHNWYKLL